MSELATDYLEHALPLRSWVGARWHLVRCPACRRYYEQVRQTIRLLSSRTLPPPSAATEADVMTRIGGPDEPPR